MPTPVEAPTPRRAPSLRVFPEQSTALPGVVAVVSVAVLTVAVGYAASRLGYDWATLAYWAGELLLAGAVTVTVLRNRGSEVVATGAVLAFTAAQYAVKVLYSPLRLKFPDELQHEQTAQGMLDTGHLFPQNFSLPIGPLYPGLQAAAIGLVGVLDVPLEAAELVVAGAAHMLLAAGVLVMFRLVVKRTDVAAIGALVYCFGSYQAFYNSFFVYQVLALPFAVLLIAQTIAIIKGDRSTGRMVLAVGLEACIVVTHHVTAMFVVVALAGLAVFARVVPAHRAAARRISVAAVTSLALLVGWIAVVAPDTVSYLAEPVRRLLHSLSGAAASAAPPGTGLPLREAVFTYASVAIPLAFVAALTMVAWRRRLRGTTALAGSATAVQLVVIAVRLLASNGQELAGRAQNFVALYVAVAVAVSLGFLAASLPGLLRRTRVRLASRPVATPVVLFCVLMALFVGGLTSGWPPRYERLPGTYQVAGYESAVDGHSLEAAAWARATLSPGGRIAADFGNLSMIGTIGNQMPLNSAYSDLFYREAFDPRDIETVRNGDIQLVLVDMRMSIQLPPADAPQSYFTIDSRGGRHRAPVDPRALEKFRDVPGVSTIFDDGTIQIYDLRGSAYAGTTS